MKTDDRIRETIQTLERRIRSRHKEIEVLNIENLADASLICTLKELLNSEQNKFAGDGPRNDN